MRDSWILVRARIWRAFNSHLRVQYQVVDLGDAIYTRAEEIVFVHSLRAADAVHLACALETRRRVGPDFQFWTADRRQAGAATVEGMAVRLVGRGENELGS